MLRLLRLAILMVLFFLIVGLVVAIARPETGAVEDAIVMAAVVALFALAVPVRRLGVARP